MAKWRQNKLTIPLHTTVDRILSGQKCLKLYLVVVALYIELMKLLRIITVHLFALLFFFLVNMNHFHAVLQ